VIKRYVVLSDERQLVDEIRRRMQATGSAPGRSRPGEPDGIPIDVKLGLREIARRAARGAEREVIEQVLTSVHWNRAEAARRLKVSYKTMLKKLGENDRGTSSRGTRAPRNGVRSA
jgi:DNA-binding NtrC family response regulator